MKIMTLPLSLLLLLGSSLAFAAETTSQTASSRITAVTVFSDSAQVTRRASIPLKAGANLVTLENMPQLMAEESLRAEGRGAGRARIAGITVKNVFLDRSKDQRVRELEDEITRLNRKVEGIEARRKALSAQRAFVDSIRVGWGERISKELSAGKPTSAELNEAVRFVGDNTGKIEEELYDAEGARKPLLEKIAALKKELEQYRSEAMKEVRSVQVAIEAERDMRFDLDLSYLVPQASWVPAYDVRLAPDGKDAALTYRAQVWQKTGEDWPQVKLTLSTASPASGGGAPELSPWRVSFFEPPRPMPYLSRSKMEMAAPAAAPAPPEKGYGAAPAEDRMEPAGFVPADVAQGQTSVQFQVAQPMDVPTDGTRSVSVIASETVPVAAEYVTVPKLSPRVYLKSTVVNRTPYPLLAGEASIFNDATFVGKSHLKTVASGEEFDLYFGSDDQVKVKREVARVKKKGGIIGGSSVTYHVTMELENYKQRPVTVSLKDQQPLPGNAEIKVAVEDAAPKPAETREDGTLVWKVELAPSEKKRVSYDLVIEYPKGRELVGLE
ncbi:mucoidy inhibitor MuiA family protein [Geomonas subterranea]|uniref:Mucoidy inhibitor MuiA family protein n=1 Tax=Geomonas subterranea TaxID=2847989 RepID=A0ABX8LNE4_9BACT|nr:mucoidy inhibitor MuiA family protein [Geomonas subterranea]QXE92230.1 mucoidy inhibitor MuiA family protein [Geomonas subterranea]QXM09670.1 mucoidy inhibitor MuiA family protein [Geomonas subterranea]